MYEFISGPMVWISLAVFFGGLAFQTVRFFSLTRKKEPVYLPPKKKKLGVKGKGKSKKKRNFILRLVDWSDRLFTTSYEYFRTSIIGNHLVMSGVTIVFHVLLFAVPLLLLAHNSLIKESIGFSLPSLPEFFTDFLTLIFLMCAFFFLARRVFVRRVRAISSLYDIFVLLVTMAPFLTGFIAYHQWFDYKIVITAHVLSGELMLIVIPFTKLGHMLFFFFYRFIIPGEHSFGQGKRAW